MEFDEVCWELFPERNETQMDVVRRALTMAADGEADPRDIGDALEQVLRTLNEQEGLSEAPTRLNAPTPPPLFDSLDGIDAMEPGAEPEWEEDDFSVIIDETDSHLGW